MLGFKPSIGNNIADYRINVEYCVLCANVMYLLLVNIEGRIFTIVVRSKAIAWEEAIIEVLILINSSSYLRGNFL